MNEGDKSNNRMSFPNVALLDVISLAPIFTKDTVVGQNVSNQNMENKK